MKTKRTPVDLLAAYCSQDPHFGLERAKFFGFEREISLRIINMLREAAHENETKTRCA